MSEPSIPQQLASGGASTSAPSSTATVADYRLSDTIHAEEQPRLKEGVARKPVSRRRASIISTTSIGSQQVRISDAASVATSASVHDTLVHIESGEVIQPHSDLLEGGSKEKGPQDIGQTSSRFWNPFWLRKAWLVAYASLYFCLASAVLALFFSSIRSEGFASSRSVTGMAYFWKFLPTAILVATLSLWNPVDHFVRLLQPWRNLSKGTAPAARTLLLDHVSRLQPVVFVSAIKHLEWPVVLATTVTIILTAIKVVSTGLLVIRPTSVSVSDIALIRSAVFDPSLWNSSSRDSEYLALYSGIRRENMAQPRWTGRDFVAEPFVLPIDTIVPENATYSATTNALFPKLSCDEANLLHQPECPETGCYYYFNMTFLSGSCEMQIEHFTATSGMKQYVYAAENYVAGTYAVSCSDEPAFLVVITQTDTKRRLSNHSALLCRPSYTAKEIVVHVDGTGEQQYSTPSHQNAIQDPVLDANMMFSYIVNGSSGTPWSRPTGNVTERDYPFFTLAAIPFTDSNSGGSYLKPFLNVETLNSSISDTFSGAFAILVSDRMLRAHNSSIKGNLEYLEDRLHVGKTPAVVICGLLLSCVALVAILVLTHTPNVVPANPNSIAGIATILSGTQEKHLFEQTSFETTRRGLKYYDFSSTAPASSRARQNKNGNKFDIVAHPNFEHRILEHSTESEKVVEKDRWWSPFTLQSWVKISALALCLAFIIALEILQRNSDRRDGLMDMPASDASRFWMSTIPALAMTGMALLFSSIHFNTTLLSPYHALACDKGASSKRSIATDYRGSTPLFTLFPAIHERHYSAAVSGIAAVVGAFLTIIVSGLYTVQTTRVSSSMAQNILDQWNTTWGTTMCGACIGSGQGLMSVDDSDGSAAYVLQYTVWGNLSDPIWAYKDLTFPSISAPVMGTNSTDWETITVTLPARRAVLECAATGPSENTALVQNITWDGRPQMTTTTIFTKVTDTCSKKPGGVFPLAVDGRDPITSYGGGVKQLYFSYEYSTNRSNLKVQALDPSSYYPEDNTDSMGESDCPSLLVYFGSFPNTIIRTSHRNISSTYTPVPVSNFTSDEAQITTLACRQKLQELDTTVTLRLPDLTIDKANPPRTDESSVRYIGGTWQWPVQTFLQGLGILPANKTFAAQAAGLGPFFAAVVHGKDGVPASELAGEANIPRLTSAVSNMYSRYMAQVMSRKMRLPLNATDQSRLVQATLTERKPRLFQHSYPKIALQVLLGVMMLCGAISWALMPNVRLLPHDPCSIAGTACLLAGEEFWGDGKKDWEEDQLFRLETRGGRFGIYAVGAESRRLVD